MTKRTRTNPFIEKIATLAAEKTDGRIDKGAVLPEHSLEGLGMTLIEICDLVVDLEEEYEISFQEDPDVIGGYSLDDVARGIKRKIIAKTQQQPSWKDSFENFIFAGRVPALRTPMSIHLDTTFRCNMRCVFCYDSSGCTQPVDELSTEEVLGILDEAAALDMIDVTFGGGEPFMRKDFPDFVEHAARLGLRSLILTNGTLITPAIARRLARVLDFRFDKIQVSLDGPTPAVHDRQRGVAGGFDMTVKGIRNLVDAGIQPVVNTVLTSFNAGTIPEMIDFLMDFGLNSYRVLRLHPLGRGKDPEFYNEWVASAETSENILEYLWQKREELMGMMQISNDFACIFPWSASRFRSDLSPMPGRTPESYACGAGTSKIAVAPDGSLFPCSYMYEFPELKIGSLREDSIETLWKRDELWKLYREQLTPSGKCKKCEYLYYCRTGCRIVSYALYGDMGAPDPGCTYEPSTDLRCAV